MLYAIIATDVANSLEARLAARPAHLERLQCSRAKAASYWPARTRPSTAIDPGAAGFTGSLIVAEFESLSAAQAWAEADPYVAAGVYARCGRQAVQASPPVVCSHAMNLVGSSRSQSLIILVRLPTTCPISIWKQVSRCARVRCV